MLPGKTKCYVTSHTRWRQSGHHGDIYKYTSIDCRSLTPRPWRDYKPLEARRIRLIYCLGEGVGKEFCCNKGALTWSPLKAYSVVLIPPTLAVEDFMILPLLSQPPQKTSVTICKQVTSILILTSYEPWTTTSHIWSSDMNWIVCEG